MWQQPSPRTQSDVLTTVRYNGPALRSTTRVYWRVCVVAAGPCASASFVTGQISQSDWSGAQWISGRQLRSPELLLPKGQTVRSAVLAISGLGFYEATLNGVKVGDAVLDPGFSTNYSEVCLNLQFSSCRSSIAAVTNCRSLWHAPDLVAHTLCHLRRHRRPAQCHVHGISGTSRCWQVQLLCKPIRGARQRFVCAACPAQDTVCRR